MNKTNHERDIYNKGLAKICFWIIDLFSLMAEHKQFNIVPPYFIVTTLCSGKHSCAFLSISLKNSLIFCVATCSIIKT